MQRISSTRVVPRRFTAAREDGNHGKNLALTLLKADATSEPMSLIRTVCVYCGSSPGTSPAFVEAARQFGAILAQTKIGLVYGGGSGGLMGAIAAAVSERNGQVTAIIPEFLKQRERLYTGAQEIIVTRDMHERKRTMFDRADAFVALPGGIGTLEELVEQLTWAQLGRHSKPILIANIDGYWDPLLTLVAHMRERAFVPDSLSINFLVTERIEDILPVLQKAAGGRAEAEKALAIPAERL